MPVAAGIHGDRHGKRAINVIFLFFVGVQLEACNFAERVIRSCQQRRCGIAGNGKALRNGDDRIVVFFQQRIGDLAGGNVGQKDVRLLESIMLTVAFHNDTVRGFYAVGLQYAVKVRERAVLSRPGNHKQLTAARQIIFQQRSFFLGNIALRRIDQQCIRIFRDFICIQEGERRKLNVLLFNLRLELAGERFLAVAFQCVNLRQLVRDHIVDGRGDGSFSVKGVNIGIGRIVHVSKVNVVIADIAALVAALHDQAVVRHVLAGVLARKVREYIRVLLGHGDMRGQAFVLAQQIFNDFIFLVRLHDPVDRHVLFQCIDNDFRAAGNRIEIGGSNIILRHGSRKDGCKNIDRNEDCQNDRCHRQRIGAALCRNAAADLIAFHFWKFHQLYLRFSSDCTVRNRPRTMTEA